MIEGEDDELPEGWVSCRMGEIAEIVGGGTPKADDLGNFSENGHAWITPADLSQHSAIYISRGRRCLTNTGLESCSARLLPRNTVVMSSRAPIGYVAIAANDICTNQGFKSFVLFSGVEPQYVYYWLRFKRDDIEQMGSGSTFLEVSGSKCKEIPFRLPPQAEQRRVVAAVECVLAKISSAQERLARARVTMKQFRRAVLAAACSGRLTVDWRGDDDNFYAPNEEMPEVPTKWQYRSSRDVVESGTVISYGIVLPGPNLKEGVPYVRGQDITDSGEVLAGQLWRTTQAIADKHKRSVLAQGDVLLCVIRHLRVAVVPEGLDGANLTQGTVRLRPGPSINRNFLAYFLQSPQAQTWMKARYIGMSMPRINVEHARQIPVPVPPMEEQEEIVRRVASLFMLADSCEQKANAALQRVESLKQAVLAKAFRGQLVPTEAELARRENRPYEPANQLLDRIRVAPEAKTKSKKVRKVIG